MDDAYSVDISNVLSGLEVDAVQGLSQTIRLRRLRIYGPNQCPSLPPKPFFKLILKQFEDLLVVVLLIAAVISFILAIAEGATGVASFVEPIVIILILIANATVGVWQETSADAAIASLKELEAESAKVVVEGQLVVTPACELVPGDIVHIATGDKIPADMRLLQISTKTLLVDESSLTGESDAVNKTTETISKGNLVDQDKTNIVFSSTLVTRGHAVGVVVQTGSLTSIGKIQSCLQNGEEQSTPLQVKLHEFGQTLSKMIGVICVVVWIVNIRHFTEPEFGGAFGGAVHFFKMAVALAVAAIPEGLPAVVTTCLALGTRRMAAKAAIVRRLASIETLGCTSVICSDKTGTLTSNEMTVRQIMSLSPEGTGLLVSVSGNGWDPQGQVRDSMGYVLGNPSQQNSSLAQIGRVSALCNQSTINYNSLTRSYSKVGESTEAALKVLSEKLGTPELYDVSGSNHTRCHRYWNENNSVSAFLEFDRDRKSMSVVVQELDSGNKQLLAKGAPESVVARCSHALLPSGALVKLGPELRIIIEVQTRVYSNDGMRCLAMAVKTLPKSFDLETVVSYADVEQEMTFVGIVAMLDPPRPAVSEAIRRCQTAGIRVVVVTGDSADTATAICLRIGIFESAAEAEQHSVTGMEFNAMTATQQLSCAARCRLFARVEPFHKQKLVELLKSHGHVVAMTGDGVNDAPALKKADIGVAMGSGTAVARDACDMVLQNDDFTSIVDAVEQGRSIFSNTRAFIRYLISSNIGEVICVFLISIMGVPEALIPVQLLWVNLVTDGLPAVALGFNPPDQDVMTKGPRSKNEPIVSSWHLIRYITVGMYIGLATVIGFIWWFTLSPSGPGVSFSQLIIYHACSPEDPRFANLDCGVFSTNTGASFALSILVTIEMLNALNALSEDQSLLVVTPASNLYVLTAIVVSFALHCTILYTPFLAIIFSVAPLSWADWRSVILFSIPVVLVDELLKLCARHAEFLQLCLNCDFDFRSRRYRRFEDDEVRSELVDRSHFRLV